MPGEPLVSDRLRLRVCDRLVSVAVVLALALAVTLLIGACGAGSTDPAPVSSQLGGDATIDVADATAFARPAPGLSADQQALFEIGEIFFNQEWQPAGTGDAAVDGLGPIFNGAGCSSCHQRTGRGVLSSSQAFDGAGPSDGLGYLVRLSSGEVDPLTGGPVPAPVYGNQFQDHAIEGVPAEGRVVVDYDRIEGTYGDGTKFELLAPRVELADLGFGPLADRLEQSARLAPQLVGMGLLEAIPAEDIEAAADPDDDDGDGISGRTNVIGDSMTGNRSLGRFGWKATVGSVQRQVADAFHSDVGITTYFHPQQSCTAQQTACLDASSGGSPELDDGRLGSVTFYNRMLGVPAMRDSDSSDVQAGAELFQSFGCASCHTTTQRTGQADLPVLSRQTIHPYTDLLLHDMGPGLADGRPEFDATGAEWRTAPLWGIGLIEEVNGHRFLLHDGRARTLDEAILWHGGEAEASREAFRLASAEQRRLVVAFLDAL